METTKSSKTWQEELSAECRKRQISAPVYNIVSDRRGGRTAWSATVTIQNQNIAARYWYDGQFLNNAKEDAAEVACTRLRNPSITGAVSVQNWMISSVDIKAKNYNPSSYVHEHGAGVSAD